MFQTIFVQLSNIFGDEYEFEDKAISCLAYFSKTYYVKDVFTVMIIHRNQQENIWLLSILLFKKLFKKKEIRLKTTEFWRH